jgi:hypothetical protein
MCSSLQWQLNFYPFSLNRNSEPLPSNQPEQKGKVVDGISSGQSSKSNYKDIEISLKIYLQAPL